MRMIRLVHIISCLALALALAVPGFVHEVVAAEAPPSAFDKMSKAERDALIDELLERLSAAPNEEEGKGIERTIQALWLTSGSPSIDLLMRRGLDALGDGDYDRAYFYFDEVVTFAPAYAEGWHRRAAIHYVREDYAAALKDIEQALRLEPRHFEALAGLGVILEDLGDRKGALDAYRRALSLNPWLSHGKVRVAPLELEVEGRGI